MSKFPRYLDGFIGLVIALSLALAQSGCESPQSPVVIATETPVVKPEISQTEGNLQAFPSVSINIGGAWQFSIDPGDVGEEEGWADPYFDDSDWQIVSVPHTWNVMKAYSQYEGVAWYRKHLELPETFEGAYFRLRFNSVFYKAMVWWNGVYLGQHQGGYTPFAFPISEVIDPEGLNVVAVRVDNLRLPDRIPDDFFDWWHYGGIVRDVTIEATSHIYIDHQQITAIPHLTGWNEADQATITTKYVLINTSSEVFEGFLRADVIDDANEESIIYASVDGKVELLPKSQIEVELRVLIDEPVLWHFDHPHLYRLVTTLGGKDDRVFHEVIETFGVRLIELKDNSFYVNGEPVRLVGMTRHADSPEYGLAEPISVMAADYDDMKRLNTVLSRPVHYPQHDFILDYCDRNGILLSPEIPAWQIEAAHLGNPEVREIAKQQLEEMILAGFNHPSIWAWSVANEIDSDTTQGHQYVQELISLAKELDPTRPVGFASYRLFGNQALDATAFTDFVFMNEYAGSWHGTKSDLPQALEQIHELWPDKVIIISEFGLEAGWTADWWMGSPSQYNSGNYYYIAPDTPPHSDDVFIQREQLILDQMDVFREYPYVAGAIFWTYQDYRSETDFHMGIVDEDRQKTPVWDVIREQFSPLWVEEIHPLSGSKDPYGFGIQLRSRGPIDEDMPAYTLRGYKVHWEILLHEGREVFMEGILTIPDMLPGTMWSGELTWNDPGEDYLVDIKILRPLGFTVLEGIYNPEGQKVP